MLAGVHRSPRHAQQSGDETLGSLKQALGVADMPKVKKLLPDGTTLIKSVTARATPAQVWEVKHIPTGYQGSCNRLQ